jgi:hypothetical protein
MQRTEYARAGPYVAGAGIVAGGGFGLRADVQPVDGVTDAARAGAQWGAQNGASAANVLGMEQAACNSMADLTCTPGTNTTATSFCQCAGSSGTISCTSPGGCANVQNFVTVTATSTFQTVTGYPGLPSSVPLTASVTMQVQ